MPVIKAFYSPRQKTWFCRPFFGVIPASRNNCPTKSIRYPVLPVKNFTHNKNQIIHFQPLANNKANHTSLGLL
jgi:hypothetical protein